MATKRVVFLGTGGTIAGRAGNAADNVGYRAGEVPVADILAAIAGMPERLQGAALGSEQIAQVDSKDMDWSVWQSLVHACHRNLQDEEVAGIVITHGTDTIEETAYFLQLALANCLNGKPVVLTCAMRPASALTPDGPQNVLDAVSVALHPAARGVMVVCAGAVHAAQHVQKAHTYRVDAFDSGDAGPLGWVEEGAVRWTFASDTSSSMLAQRLPEWVDATPPRVEVVMNYAGAGAHVIQAVLNARDSDPVPLAGLVVAGTGNGTVNEALQAALVRAAGLGVQVVLASRCARGGVVRSEAPGTGLRVYPGLSAVKARVQLMCDLLA
ncbi:asparaginase [Rhodoferax sp. TBRC 17660]|uniref:Asparaginase n=1 Tax=Rhodoferax potami TaxID=3068338 RepID=A0ABU3KJ86_9BURK|nr:asparaginase [Rhodoferax sp. TBRC 17660]MDT7517503.1 asparaginase [Rhodoferax sp. TBRC 17660]